jgi:hypothetical protein
MSRPSDETALAGLFELLPEQHADDAMRARFDKLEKHLDGMLFLDHTAELAVDRDAFLAYCRDEEFVLSEVHDITILETAKYLGRRIKGYESKGRRLSWREAENYGLPGHSAVAELREHGYSPSMSQEEIEKALAEWYPDYPFAEAFSQFDGPDARAKLVRALQRNRTFWDCLVANFGWWAALTLAGSMATFGILVLSGVPWQVALAIAIAYSGALTIYIVGQCLVNPEYYWWA